MGQLMYDNILRYLCTGQLPKELGKNQKDALSRKSKNFWSVLEIRRSTLNYRLIVCNAILKYPPYVTKSIA